MRKKTIALAMSVLMAATLSACGGSGTADTTAATTTAAETTKAAADDTTAATEAEAEADNTDGRIVRCGIPVSVSQRLC